MTDQPILRARTSAAVVPASEAGAQLDVDMRKATAIAKAGDAIPKSYRGNTGAVLLANEWAHARGIDLLTAMQSVAFVQGKPVIDASMQRALAKRSGYRVIVTEASPKSATVKVSDADGELGSATYTLDDAKRAGLDGKDNWKKNPEDMLVARATTRAMRRFAAEVMVGVLLDDEAEQLDPVTVLTDSSSDGDGSSPAPSPSDITDAEIVDNDDPALPLEDIRIRMIDAVNGLEHTTKLALRTWVDAQGWPADKRQLDDVQAQGVLDWIGRRG